MAGRPAEPWFRASKNAWYVTLDGKKVSLGVRGEGSKDEALKAWHRLCANGREEKTTAETPTVKALIDAFLSDAESRVKAKTAHWYREFLAPFADAFANVKADRLTKAQAEAYARKPSWSASTRNGFLGTLASAFAWAMRQSLIVRNPLNGIRKPPKASRGTKALVSAEDHETLCRKATPLFRAFLQLLWHTGARPGEIASLTAESVNLQQGVAILTDHKTAHHGKSRIVFLSPEAVAILQERIAECPHGLLFPDENGARMTPQTVCKRVFRLCKATGVKATAYGYRHSFATDALANGVPDATVAALMGHSSTVMLHKHYAHLTARAKALRSALEGIR